jgi:threonine synthase
MRYTSTRDSSPTSIDVSFAEAITSGYAPDGGLFVPRWIPKIPEATLRAWIVTASSSSTTKLSYAEVMYHVLRLFIDVTELSDAELQQICHTAVQGFSDPTHVIPVLPLQKSDGDDDGGNGNNDDDDNNDNNTGNNSNDHDSTTKKNNVYVAELFHGPTFCFKDLGMRAVIHLLYTFLQQNKKRPTANSNAAAAANNNNTTTHTNNITNISLLVSTTGDTGPAAAQTVYDIQDPRLNILIHYPYQQISDFQRKQLTTLSASSSTTTTSTMTKLIQPVQIVAFHGDGDDMDGPIKNILYNHQQQVSSSLWTGVNSYNIVRFGFCVCVCFY